MFLVVIAAKKSLGDVDWFIADEKTGTLMQGLIAIDIEVVISQKIEFGLT